MLDGRKVLIHGTDPIDQDTDGDGMPDGDEIAAGANPLDPSDPLRGRLFLVLEIACGICLASVIIKISRAAPRFAPLKGVPGKKGKKAYRAE